MNIENIFTDNLPSIEAMMFDYLNMKWSHEKHSSPVWEMIYVNKGKVKLEIGENTYQGKPRDIFFIPPEKFHRDRFIKPYSYRVCTIFFDWKWMTLFFKHINNKKIKKIELNARLEIYEIINKMWEEFKEGRSGFKSLMNMYLKEIFIIIARNTLQFNEKIINKYDINSHNILNTVRKYIDNNYSKQITLQTLTEKTKISPFHLTRLFSKDYGLPPHQYLIKVRIDNAKKLLANRKLSVKEIAYMVGFENPNYFGKVFKKNTKNTPLKYRDALSVS